jgi:hypothetical protein
MIHRCQILKADLKHCQHLGGDDPTRVPDSKLLMLNFAIPSALTVRAPVNSKLGPELENWTKTSVGTVCKWKSRLIEPPSCRLVGNSEVTRRAGVVSG